MSRRTAVAGPPDYKVVARLVYRVVVWTRSVT